MAQPKDLYDRDFLGERAHAARARTRHERRMRRLEVPGDGRRFEHVALEGQVRLRAFVYPTESRANVEAGVRALFPDAQFEPSGGGAGELRATARSLVKMAEVLRHTRIRDSARAALCDAVDDDGALRFQLNKQAACAGRVNFLEGPEVLGALDVEVLASEPRWLVEEVTWIEGESDERLLGTKLHTLPPRRRRRGP